MLPPATPTLPARRSARVYLPTGFFYLVSQMHYQKEDNRAAARPGKYPCCFTEWIARSKDLSL